MGADDPNQRDYETLQNHLLAALQSSYQQYDTAVLTLSTGLLGISVAFVAPDAEKPTPHNLPLLFLSWFSLLLAIISTVLSFLSSQQATQRALDDAHDLFRLGKLEALEARNVWSKLTGALNLVSAVGFVLGAVLTVWFVVANTT